MRQFSSSLSAIVSDNTSGSGELLDRLMDVTKGFLLRQSVQCIPSEFSEQLSLVAEKLRVFPVVRHFINELLDFHQSHAEASACLQAIESYGLRWSDISLRLSRQALSVIQPEGKTFITHSKSAAVQSFFAQIKKEGSSVPLIIQTVSHPANEGKLQAGIIADMGFDVMLIEDAAIGREVRRADAVISGADALCRNHFLNKTGTRLLALAAKYEGIPFYVMADPRKHIAHRDEAAYRQLVSREDVWPASEIWKHPPSGIRIANHYFEWTERELIENLISDI